DFIGDGRFARSLALWFRFDRRHRPFLHATRIVRKPFRLVGYRHAHRLARVTTMGRAKLPARASANGLRLDYAVLPFSSPADSDAAGAASASPTAGTTHTLS